MIMADLNVLYVSPWDREGGLATYSQYLVPRLREYCSVDVYDWDSESVLVRGTGVHLLTLTFLRLLRKADVVHLQYSFGRYLLSLPVLLLLATLFRTPVVITQHERFDNLPSPSILHGFHQLCYFMINRVIVHTDDRLELVWEVHSSRLAVIEHGVIHRTDVNRKSTDVETILFPGIVRPIKGHEIAVESLQYLDDVKLRIVGGIGDDEYWREVTDRITDLGVDDRIEVIAEYVPEERLFEELREADIVVLPYEPHTSMSGILAHCLSWRVPTLLTDCPAFRSVVECEEAFLPERTGCGIAKQVKEIRDDPTIQDRIIRAFGRLSEAYSWEATAERTVEVYAATY
jgi:glycosyltransferase involved in cell wall biosynthesis